jgi:hypothetical protein
MQMRRQSKSLSWFEASTNVALGFMLALVIQVLVYPLFGIATTLTTNGAVAAIFTAASLVRSYLVRRAFEDLGRFLPSNKGPRA